MGRTLTQRRRFAGSIASVAMLALLVLSAPQTNAQAVAEGTVTSEFISLPTPANTLAVGGFDLECFTLQFDATLPEPGTVYTIGDTDAALSARDQHLIALTLGARNHTFEENSELARAGTTGRLDVIVQLTIWAYADDYDLAVASSEERDAVVALQAAVEVTADAEDGSLANPITPAPIIFAVAPNPELAHLVVLPPQATGPVTETTGSTTETTTGATLLPAVTATAPTTAPPTTAAQTTAPPTTEEPTTTAESTTTEATTTTEPEIAASTITTTTAVASTEPDNTAPGPDPTVLGSVQERSPLGSIGTTSAAAIGVVALFLAAGIAVAFVATRRTTEEDT